MSTDSLNDEQREEALRDRAVRAYVDGNFEDAFAAFHACVLSCALRWFREEGIRFGRPRDGVTPTELMVGLAVAATRELREQGDAASDKLSAATWLFCAAADLRTALEVSVSDDVDAVARKIAEVTMRGMVLGQMDAIMTAVRLGWLDALTAHEIDRARRRSGAEATNRRKATRREDALGVALQLSGKNPTLSHEDIAVKVRESLGLPTTIKTLTSWVREWRRQGFIPVRKAL